MNWPQKLDLKTNFWGQFFNAKYDLKFKLKVVKEYLEGNIEYLSLAK